MNMPPISMAAEKIFSIWEFIVTNSILTCWVTTLLFIGIVFIYNRKPYRVPNRFQALIESSVEMLFNATDQVLSDRQTTRRYFPLIGALFLFIVVNNLFGLFPGVGTLGVYQEHHGHIVLVPFLRAATADLNMTLALGAISVVATQFYGIGALGLGGHLSKFFNFKGPIDFFVGILELISEFAKIVSFGFRLFGNIFAGEVLLTVVTALVPVMAAVPFYFLEIFVGFVQALVFMMLTVVFIKIHTAAHAH